MRRSHVDSNLPIVRSTLLGLICFVLLTASACSRREGPPFPDSIDSKQSTPPPEELAGLVASYIERGTMETKSLPLSGGNQGPSHREFIFQQKMHRFRVVNTFSKIIDSEQYIVFDVIAFTYLSTSNPIRVDDGTIRLNAFRGRVACVKRGNQWYGSAFSVPEAVKQTYVPTDAEQKALEAAIKEIAPYSKDVKAVEAVRSKVFHQLFDDDPRSD